MQLANSIQFKNPSTIGPLPKKHQASAHWSRFIALVVKACDHSHKLCTVIKSTFVFDWTRATFQAICPNSLGNSNLSVAKRSTTTQQQQQQQHARHVLAHCLSVGLSHVWWIWCSSSFVCPESVTCFVRETHFWCDRKRKQHRTGGEAEQGKSFFCLLVKRAFLRIIKGDPCPCAAVLHLPFVLLPFASLHNDIPRMTTQQWHEMNWGPRCAALTKHWENLLKWLKGAKKNGNCENKYFSHSSSTQSSKKLVLKVWYN